MFLHVSVILSTGGACMVALGGACVVALGGVHGYGCSWGGHAWLLLGGMCGCCRGACVVAPRRTCMVAPGRVHGCSGGHACVVAPGGACVVAAGGHAGLLGGHAWDMTRYGDTINEWAVRILLECILVSFVKLITVVYIWCCGSILISYTRRCEFE